MRQREVFYNKMKLKLNKVNFRCIECGKRSEDEVCSQCGGEFNLCNNFMDM